ncbi:hypothetical protein FA15DRAFT_600246 [Coprinopsis marcescibilis]|uniref:Uncharacterized protein n=1 Tax=Coprinopsis marcescibilis TaxID=230819 RepID=A0A5C3KJR4_COPMA|nr:hypothetical protein FA15DRAFT_600246 [Coprinopsis marcescibilis]
MSLPSLLLPALTNPAVATITSPFAVSRPLVSSPLAESFGGDSLSHSQVPRPQPPPRRNSGFAPSRALRPFPAISHALQPSKSSNTSSNSKPIKLIEPPKNFKMTFVLDLTQAEFSRQD